MKVLLDDPTSDDKDVQFTPVPERSGGLWVPGDRVWGVRVPHRDRGMKEVTKTTNRLGTSVNFTIHDGRPLSYSGVRTGVELSLPLWLCLT